jgi:hypothetical protein
MLIPVLPVSIVQHPGQVADTDPKTLIGQFKNAGLVGGVFSFVFRKFALVLKL